MAFRFASSSLASLSVLLVAACQTAPPTMSMPCTRASDCDAPLICNDSMVCDEWCRNQRDCIGGTHCGISSAGECFIDQPLDHTSSPCGPGRDCPEGNLVCRDFTCWTPCTTAADCVAESICRQGVCANPSSPGSGYGVHTPCAADTDCATGERCASDHGSERACRRTCTADAQCADVAVDEVCAAIDDPALPAGTMACVIGCDPVRQLGCINRDRCEVGVAAGPDGMATFLECRAPTGMGIQGAACGSTDPMFGSCDQNLGCAPAMADMTGGYECRRFCVVDGDCHSTTLACTGPTAVGIDNLGVVVGALHMCEPM